MSDAIGAVVIMFNHATGPVPGDREVLGSWRMDTIDGGPIVTATLGDPPTVDIWWSERPRRGAVEAWYRAEVQPAISLALARYLGDHVKDALVVTPEQAVELLAAWQAVEAMKN